MLCNRRIMPGQREGCSATAGSHAWAARGNLWAHPWAKLAVQDGQAQLRPHRLGAGRSHRLGAGRWARRVRVRGDEGVGAPDLARLVGREAEISRPGRGDLLWSRPPTRAGRGEQLRRAGRPAGRGRAGRRGQPERTCYLQMKSRYEASVGAADHTRDVEAERHAWSARRWSRSKCASCAPLGAAGKM